MMDRLLRALGLGPSRPLPPSIVLHMPPRHCEECGAAIVDGNRPNGFDPATGAPLFEFFRACPTILEYLLTLPRGHYPARDGKGPTGGHYHYFPGFWHPWREGPDMRPSPDRKGWG